jgi:ATP-dependent helicase/nuclease subunit A
MSGPAADAGERVRIASDLDTTLFVEAGAGTGKTTALVARVTNLVASGRVSLGEVAAITFTEAAAAELRERIRLDLERAATDRVRPDDERRRCAAALDDVDEAALQTLHGFANRILSAHAVEAGLPPGFSVRDATQVEVAFGARWTAFLTGLQRDAALGPPLKAAVSLGLTVDNLHDVARSLHDAWDLADRATLDPPASLASVAAPVAAAMDEVVALRPLCALSLDTLAKGIDERLVPWWQAVRRAVADAGDDASAVAQALEQPVPKLGNAGKAANWNVPVTKVRAAAKSVVEAYEEARRCVRQHLLEHLLPALVGFTVEGAEERRQEGVLEYHDLLVRARSLLRADPAVRRAVGLRHRVVLVDEFQDTDPLQVDLAVLACTSADGPIPDERPWSELPVPPGRLFFVGDPKQSIYRFRRADIDLYARVRDGLGGSLAPLVSNFRSTPAVVDSVNATFGPWFDEQGEGQAPWRDLVVGRQAEDVRGTVAVLGGVQEAVPAQQAREVAAADVVACVRLALERRWPVRDERLRSWRPARADDITVLLPTRTALPALERAFEDAGVPYRVEARSLVWATQEVRDLLSVLRAVADPSDEVAVAAALLSGVLACSHEDLRTWRAAGGSWDHSSGCPDGVPAGHPVAAAMACLAAWAERAPWANPASLLDSIVRERAVLEAAFAQPRQREAWNRTRFLIEQARAVAASGTSALRAFVDWADRQADEQAQALESVVPEPDDHAVRVLTIHSAKGLEFPITIVAGLNVPRGGSVTPPTRVLWGPAGRIELSCGAQQRGFRTAGFTDLAAREQVRAAQEQTRLLYVACTRARDHLVVCTHRTGSTRDESSAAADLSAWMAGVPGIVHGLDELAGVTGLASEEPAAAALISGRPPQRSVSLAEWEGRRRAALARAGRPAAIPATAVADLENPDEPPTLDLGPVAGELGAPPLADGEEAGLLSTSATGRGMPFGRAVHALLEHAPLGAPLDPADPSVVGRAAALGAAEGVDPAEVVAAASAAACAPRARAAAGARRSWREAFVAAEIEGVVVEGFVDLLWEDEAGLHVGDWKTDQVASAADRKAKVERYGLQLATYAVALEHVAGRPVVELVLIFCTPEGAHEAAVTGAPLDEAKASVRRRLALSRRSV